MDDVWQLAIGLGVVGLSIAFANILILRLLHWIADRSDAADNMWHPLARHRGPANQAVSRVLVSLLAILSGLALVVGLVGNYLT